MEGLDFLPACRWLGERYLTEPAAASAGRRRATPPPRPMTRSAKPPARNVAPDSEVYGWILDQSPLGADGRAYLSARGFSPTTLAVFRVGQVGDRQALRRAALDQFGNERLRRWGCCATGAGEPS